MNVIPGGKQEFDMQEYDYRMRAWGLAIELLRSAGNEHATRMTIDEFKPVVEAAYAWMKTGRF